MSDLLKSRVVPVKKAKGMSPRRELICNICSQLNIPQQYATGLFFQTNGIFTDAELIALKDKALAWEGKTLEAKARWFRNLVSEKREEIKQMLKNVQPNTPN
jgi:hypothetical protein